MKPIKFSAYPYLANKIEKAFAEDGVEFVIDGPVQASDQTPTTTSTTSTTKPPAKITFAALAPSLIEICNSICKCFGGISGTAKLSCQFDSLVITEKVSPGEVEVYIEKRKNFRFDIQIDI